MPDKIRVEYWDSLNPIGEGVTYVVINARRDPPCLWEGYFDKKIEEIPQEIKDSDDVFVFPKDIASKLFDFQEIESPEPQ